MVRTPVYILCSPRPLVGKTLIARTLTEFLLLQRRDVVAFDVNVKEPSLLDYLPNVTETANIDDTFGKMALMDRLILNDQLAKVIDLGYHAFSEFFVMLDEIGFLKEAARRGVAPQVLFFADSDRVSLRAFQDLQTQIPPRLLLTIDNEYVLRGELPRVYAQSRVLPVAALPNFLKTYVDRLGFSFTGYLRAERDSSTELHQWIRRNYTHFRDIDMELSRPPR